ncbi:MAG: ATP-binding protein [Hydrogenophaga sp.]|uniref:PAS domain-containing sensor histidine kinase n=1 Tax=Hydrogenophaga sp. TaxID=1904254 RepID=UPI002761B510|nr:ATP-binding protein [Hydrogenophaga sp.]MDP2418264.1 ATP-binding protein [Hydrogenophaga sp.]MDZ4188286.1 ATP-binding protein [Hydrogenophaga sp.]
MSKPRSPSPLPTVPMEGVDESTWLDVIQKMDEVYTRLIDDEVELEKKNAELEQSQQFIFSVLTSMSDVLVVCDERGLIEQANAALCELVGRNEEQLRGSSLADLLADPASVDAARAAMDRSGAPRSGQGIELNLLDLEGQPVPVDANCTPRIGPNGRRVGTVWVGRPTAELKRAYHEMRAAHDALKRTQQQLLHSEKMASLGQLVAGVAHELNNPISFVLGNVYALRKYCDRLQTYMAALHAHEPEPVLQALRHKLRIDHLMGDLHSLIEGTIEGAQRTADIVHSLKRFSAMDPEERTRVNLVEVIERAIHWVQKGRHSPMDVRWQAGPPCTVMGSAGQLQQVMMNLLQNAFDAVGSPRAAAPCVWVSVACEGERVRVCVRDNGPGIAPEHLLRIFDPFFTTKPVGKGTGLGLSISYGIVEQHGGRLSARNAEGGGAEFQMELSRADT